MTLTRLLDDTDDFLTKVIAVKQRLLSRAPVDKLGKNLAMQLYLQLADTEKELKKLAGLVDAVVEVQSLGRKEEDAS